MVATDVNADGYLEVNTHTTASGVRHPALQLTPHR